MNNLPMQSGYDKSIVAFSPDGRILQIEYAREAVKRGTTAIGIKTKNEIVLLSTRQIFSPLIEISSIEKIYQIDNHIAATISGITADGRILIEKARIEAQINMATYDEPIGVEILTKKICDYIYLYTQSGGIRPFGTSLLIGGIENNITRLFETDPSGSLFEWKAIGIGAYRPEIMKILEEHYKENMKIESAIKLGLTTLINVYPNINSDSIEITIINEKYYKLTTDEIKKYLEEVF